MPVECKGKSGIWWNQLRDMDSTLGMMRMRGFGPGIPGYDAMWTMRGEIMGKLGLKVAKPVNLILKLVGLSPGVISLYYDSEGGWFTDARVKPGAPPIYHYVRDDVAIAILKGEITPELHDFLMTPDDYLGE